MNACHRIFLSLTAVGLAVLAGPLPTAEAQGIPAGVPGRGQPRPPVPVPTRVRPNAVPARTPVLSNPVRVPTPLRPNLIPPVAPRPGWNAYTGIRPGWAARPYGNYWLGRGVVGWQPYGVNWYAPSYSSWYFPDYVFRTPYTYYANPTTTIDLTTPGFSGGFNTMVPTVIAGDPQPDLLQPPVVPIQQ